MKYSLIITSLLWRFAERSGSQLTQFLLTIILARILEPEVFGTVALVTVLITILNVFVDSGLGTALIQKKDADNLDFSTVFYFNIFFSGIIYVIVYIFAPYIAKFYGNNQLVDIIRVLSITIVIAALRNVQQAYVSKRLQFKVFFYATLGGVVASAVIGITLAYLDYGIWALVIQQLANVLIGTIILWLAVEWRPLFSFSFIRLKSLFSYGWKLLCAALLDVSYQNLTQLIIGKIYAPIDLAYYNRGYQFPNTIIGNINASIDSVLLPTLSNEQNDIVKVKQMTRKAVSISSFIIWPLVMGLAGAANQVVSIVLTDKWLPCVPYLQCFCFSLGFMPVHTANLNAIKALGKSDIFLKLEIVKKFIGFFAIVLSMRYGPLSMAFSTCITSVICAFVNANPNKKLLSYSISEQLSDMVYSMILSIIMGCIVYSCKYLGFNNYLTLFLQIIIGVIFYLMISMIFKMRSFEWLICNLSKSFKSGV
ncbi:MAG: lipopolysaccharide biosynthesis protein [Phascolarctobacterium sp.]|nr:lipopolysaccharide biosynthesis protein [Phascolarctobacterium sp.]